jgi:hypothetical protein
MVQLLIIVSAIIIRLLYDVNTLKKINWSSKAKTSQYRVLKKNEVFILHIYINDFQGYSVSGHLNHDYQEIISE